MGGGGDYMLVFYHVGFFSFEFVEYIVFFGYKLELNGFFFLLLLAVNDFFRFLGFMKNSQVSKDL